MANAYHVVSYNNIYVPKTKIAFTWYTFIYFSNKCLKPYRSLKPHQETTFAFQLLAEMLASFQQNFNTSPSVLINYDPTNYFRGGKKSINKSAHLFFCFVWSYLLFLSESTAKYTITQAASYSVLLNATVWHVQCYVSAPCWMVTELLLLFLCLVPLKTTKASNIRAKFLCAFLHYSVIILNKSLFS